MAGNTIAKLAVVVSTDTGPMASGFRQGGDIIKRSADNMQGGFNSAAERLKFFKDAAGASTGSIRDLAGVLRSGAGVAGLAVVGVATLGVGLLKSAQAADTMAQRAVKVADEWEAAYQRLTGKQLDIGFNKLDTWGGQWDRLKEAALKFFAIIGENSGIYDALLNATRNIADAFERLNQIFQSDESKAKDARLEQLKKETEEIKKQAELKEKMDKEAEAAAKKAAEEQQRALDAMKSRAESIAQSLRTPAEVFRDTAAELRDLFDQGLLSSENFFRGMQKARDDLDKTKKNMDTARQASDTRVGALERFTMGGFSAAQRSGEKKLEENSQKTADNTGKAARALQELLDEFRRKTGISPPLMQSNF